MGTFKMQLYCSIVDQSRGCSQADLIATGGNGLFYRFAQ
jgi:hypothetical protein